MDALSVASELDMEPAVRSETNGGQLRQRRPLQLRRGLLRHQHRLPGVQGHGLQGGLREEAFIEPARLMPHPAVYAINGERQGAAHSSHSVGIEIKAHQSGSGLFIVADRLGAGPAPGLIVRLRPLGQGHRQLRILSQPVPGPVPDLQIHPGSIAV